MALSGGMKRRVMIAKALSPRAEDPLPRRTHAPASTSSCGATCGRWCAASASSGVTIILTTHYIEEAEEMADRVGVINKGELILVEEKNDADAQARQEAAHARSAGAARRKLPAGLNGYTLELCQRRPPDRLQLRRAGRRHRHPGVPEAPHRTRRRLQGPPHRANLARRHLRFPGALANEHPRHPSHLSLRNGALVSHHRAEPVLAGALDLALFHRVRLGDRLAHDRHRRRQLRRIHRAGPDHAHRS